AGGRDHGAAALVGGRPPVPPGRGRTRHRRHRLHAGCEHFPVPANTLLVSRVAAPRPSLAALALRLRPAGVPPAVRGRGGGPARLLPLPSPPAALRARPDLGGHP